MAEKCYGYPDTSGGSNRKANKMANKKHTIPAQLHGSITSAISSKKSSHDKVTGDGGWSKNYK